VLGSWRGQENILFFIAFGPALGDPIGIGGPVVGDKAAVV
jgi:hypothetical protein